MCLICNPDEIEIAPSSTTGNATYVLTFNVWRNATPTI